VRRSLPVMALLGPLGASATILLLSANGAAAQVPPPLIPMVPNPNPISTLVLPAPGPVYVPPRHPLKKNHAVRGQRNHSASFEERISEMQRYGDGAEAALGGVIGETGRRAKRTGRSFSKDHKY
jgi:hypothetical protein